MFELSEKKLHKPFSNDIDKPQIFFFLKKILGPDSSFFWMSAIYGIVISLLSLAVPMSVQSLINSISFTALVQPIIVLSVIIFILLTFYGIINALQLYVTEIFQRRFFARMSCEVGLSLLNADHVSFEEANSDEMVNRFFDTLTIQKTIPKFLTKTFTIILQSIVGLIVISFYHPIFLIFSFFVVSGVAAIWFCYYKKAVTSSFYESRRKYDVVGCLEDLAGRHQIFKSRSGYNYAKFKIDFLTGQYLKERRRHFINLFSQTVLLFALYAIMTAALLGIGGWLVLEGQLTIGQLVAAELIMSAILYNIAQMGREFENFYDLVAACEKLSQFQNIPQEQSGSVKINKKISELKFENACYNYLNNSYKFNLTFKSGKNYLIATKGFSTQKILIELINGFRNPSLGSFTINDIDVETLDKYDLRSHISIIDNSPLIEGTVREYLTFNNKNISQKEINQVIKIVGLEKTFERLPEELETRIIPSGWPFLESEKILLKIARALLHKSQIIIITEVLDMLILQARRNILKYLTQNHENSVIYFSHRVDEALDFDSYLFVDKTQAYEFSTIEKLDEFERGYEKNDQ